MRADTEYVIQQLLNQYDKIVHHKYIVEQLAKPEFADECVVSVSESLEHLDAAISHLYESMLCIGFNSNQEG